MDQLLKKRRIIQNNINRIQTAINKNDTILLTSFELNSHFEKLTGLNKEADELEGEISIISPDADQPVHDGIFETINIKIMELKVSLVKLQHAAKDHVPMVNARSEIRLPKLELPKFTGNLQEWVSFHDLFTAVVHSNNSLSGAQKLQYLKASLNGQPASLIASFQISDANYDEAWNMLVKRYQHTRELVFSTLNRLLNQPSVSSEYTLRHLIDNTHECIRTLSVLNQPIDQWDSVLVCGITNKLDSETRREWEIHLTDNEIPEYSAMKEFMDSRARALAVSQTPNDHTTKQFKQHQNKFKGDKFIASHHGAAISTLTCVLEDGEHPIYKCTKFLNLSIADRISTIKRNSLCLNCLRPGHIASKCTGSSCRRCKAKHNTLLHFEDNKSSSHQTMHETSVSSHIGNHDSCNQVLLATAVIKVRDSIGNLQICRALLDQGSESSFITEECSQRLGLKRNRVQVNISGLSSSQVGTSKSKVLLSLSSCTNSNFYMQVDALILQKITGKMPHSVCNKSNWLHINNLKLADPEFYIPRNIDILLGADVVADITLTQKISGLKGSPIAQETDLGWILSGRIDGQVPHINSNLGQIRRLTFHTNQVNSNDDELESMLERFWKLENRPVARLLTIEEGLCEQHFRKTHRRENGKFTLRLPFRQSEKTLGESRGIAIRRWKSVERRLEENPNLRSQYVKFMSDYLEMNHIQVLCPSESNKVSGYYIPHHAIEATTKAKFRVVFDASAKSSTGTSLNELLMVGPTLQDNLTDIVLRFRLHKIAFIADISKMYRRFQIHQDDQDFQRIVWRKSRNEPLTEYKLLTVTYGTSAAPYMATKALQQLASDEELLWPIASKITKSDFYVDDLLSGASSVELAINIQQQLIALMGRGGLELTKWISNSTSFMDSVPTKLKGNPTLIELCKDENVKALGLLWNPTSDKFTFKFKKMDHGFWTKRRILSEIAKLFDPLGMLSPVIIRARIIMQQCWQLKIHWDDQLPLYVQETWLNYYCELSHLHNIHIPRWVTVINPTRYQILGFCDASEKAYASCIYLKTTNDSGNVQVELLTSKTRVAPLKQVSIPRLELCGAVLLATEVESVQRTLTVNINAAYLWTDSTIVLCWLNSCPSRWKTFVANRVSEIHSILPNVHWQHVITSDNPADCATRGLGPQELKDFKLWWHGPSWTKNDLSKNQSPVNFDEIHSLAAIEEKSTTMKSFLSNECEDFNNDLSHRFSSWSKLLRITAYCLRFIKNAKLNSSKRVHQYLTTAEIQVSIQYRIKYAQATEFQQEINCKKKGINISSKSRVVSLHVFLDDNGVLRVGVRLQNSQLSTYRKNPMLLPAKHIITRLIINHTHLRNLHAGPQLMLTSIQRQFWIIGARDLIRYHVRKCITCYRFKSTNMQQLMAALPSARVHPSRPFSQCGVDYAGPFEMKVLKGRSKTFKVYIALFICFSTRAIHLEAVSDATTNGFLAALHRFIARRGKPHTIHSDCGSNFIGANKELKNLLNLFRGQVHNKQMSTQLLEDDITWKFNPPGAPHFGGIWEAGVKSIKHHLKRVAGNASMNFEEFTTLLYQIEAIVNSRPLTALSTDPNDLEALTPGHFLIGAPLTSIPEPDLGALKLNRLSRWQLVQRIQQDFWKRWHREYLSRLQQRPKWANPQRNVQVGDLVLLKDESLSPLNWKLARVMELHPGSDQRTRVVTIKTSEGS